MKETTIPAVSDSAEIPEKKNMFDDGGRPVEDTAGSSLDAEPDEPVQKEEVLTVPEPEGNAPDEKVYDIPSVEHLTAEYKRARYQDRYRRTLLNTVFTLITVAASAILVATIWLPVLRIYGNSMETTLFEGDIVATVKTEHLHPGDIVAFYYNNQVLVKRYIAGPGEWVDIDEHGNVYVNNKRLEEPYILEKSLGECNIELPYQVPENKIFVLGDHRSISKDSRDKSIGCVDDEQMVGKLIFRVWPLVKFGFLK